MKLELTFHGPVEETDLDRNREYVGSLGLSAPKRKRKRPPLAVVGGGPSLAENVETLRRWKGDVWISCSAFPWCRERGIKGTFFNLDPQPSAARFTEGVEKALLASCNDPSVFDALKGADVEVFDTRETIQSHTTVTAAPMLGLEIGHKRIAFFGCDSSYEEKTHVYQHYSYPDVLKVKCDGRLYTTSQALLGQAQCLAEFIRAVPKIARCRSGGLLAAMCRDPDYDVVGMDRKTAENMKVNGVPLPRMGRLVPFREEEHA